MEFSYQAQTASGENVKGILEADSLQRAEELLWRSNLTIISLKKQLKLPSLADALPSLFGAKRSDVINFSRDLATMLDAGVPMLRSLDILYRQAKKPGVKQLLRGIIQDLEKGSTFSEACGRHPQVFSKFFVQIIRVGEEVGSLATVLQQLSAYLTKQEETAAKVKAAMGYPIFVLCLAFVAVFIMIRFVMPALTALFAEFGSELPPLARFALAGSGFVTKYFWYITLGLIILIVGLGMYFKTPQGKKVRDTIILKLPLIGEASLKNSLAQTGRSLAMMVRTGVPLTEAMALCIDTASNAVVKDRLIRTNDGVLAGATLSQAMAVYPIFPVLMTQMIGIGEETGRLESNLDTLAGFYEKEAERAIARLTGMLGPGMIVIVGLVVGFVAVTLFSSIYSIGGLIK